MGPAPVFGEIDQSGGNVGKFPATSTNLGFVGRIPVNTALGAIWAKIAPNLTNPGRFGRHRPNSAHLRAKCGQTRAKLSQHRHTFGRNCSQSDPNSPALGRVCRPSGQGPIWAKRHTGGKRERHASSMLFAREGCRIGAMMKVERLERYAWWHVAGHAARPRGAWTRHMFGRCSGHPRISGA